MTRVGRRSTLDALEGWKRERLAGGQGYRIDIGRAACSASSWRCPRSTAPSFVAPLLDPRRAAPGSWSCARRARWPGRSTTRLRGADVTGRPRAGERGPHRGSAAQAERGAVRLARAQLLATSSCVVEPDTTITYASPSAAARARLPGRRPRGHAVRRPDPRRGQDARDVVPDDDRRGRGAHGPHRVPRAPHSDGELRSAPRRSRTNLLHDPNVQGHRAQHPRHQRAQGVRGAAVAPGVPRPAHRAREPRAVPRPRDARARAPGARRQARVASCSWTSTTSRRSTTRSGTPPAISCCARSASACRQSCGRADTAARLGGDEFAVLLEDGGDADRGGRRRRAADRRCSRSRSTLEDKEVFVRATHRDRGGASPATSRSTTPRSCCATPTSRCTWPRRTARTAIRCSSPRCTTPRCKRLELKADLQRALEHGEFSLHYQPVIELETGPDLGRRGADPLDPPRARASCRRSTSSRSPRRPA